jgi:transcriptional regulator with XRE-family HTH domain
MKMTFAEPSVDLSTIKAGDNTSAVFSANRNRRSTQPESALGVRAGLEPDVASLRINQYERGKHEPQIKTAKQLAEALGVPAAFLYTDDELLAKLLLRWNELTVRQRKALLKQAEAPAPTRKRVAKQV